MDYFDQKAHVDRISAAPTVQESLTRVVCFFNGLTNSTLESDRLTAIFLFATEGPDVRLAMVMDCYISNLHTYEVVNGPLFTVSGIEQIRELLRVADAYQAKLLADEKPPVIGDNLKVLYCRRPAPRTDDKVLPHDAADSLLKHFWSSPVPTPSGEEFLRLFTNEQATSHTKQAPANPASRPKMPHLASPTGNSVVSATEFPTYPVRRASSP